VGRAVARSDLHHLHHFHHLHHLLSGAAIIRILLCVCLVALEGCSAYRHQPYRAADRTSVETENYTLHFVEADDEGWFWDPGQANQALELVRRKAAERNTIVVVFIHGWHHSAQCCDDEVEGFKETLIRLNRQLSAPAHEAMQTPRAESTRELNVVGIYIGWRGRSLPGFINYFTFWGRKAAAERVGNTDFSEFLARLNNLYLQHNSRRQDEAPEQAPRMSEHFLGLVTIGHSFGGQVLMKAIGSTLEEQLIRNNPVGGYLRTAKPTSPRHDTRALSGFGDLLVLLNPATEAAQYHRLYILSQGLEYPPEQTPIMLTVSARNDVPRHRLFTFGRILGEFFTGKPRKADPIEREVERKALGVYQPHITHRLVAADPASKLISTSIEHAREPGCPGQGPCLCEFLEWERPPTLTEKDSITAGAETHLHAFDFSADLTFANVKLLRQPNAIPYQPFIVAEADESIIDGHNGIFTAPFLEFLVSYIAFVETKYAQLR
jgi:hypothetical protein